MNDILSLDASYFYLLLTAALLVAAYRHGVTTPSFAGACALAALLVMNNAVYSGTEETYVRDQIVSLTWAAGIWYYIHKFNHWLFNAMLGGGAAMAGFTLYHQITADPTSEAAAYTYELVRNLVFLAMGVFIFIELFRDRRASKRKPPDDHTLH